MIARNASPSATLFHPRMQRKGFKMTMHPNSDFTPRPACRITASLATAALITAGLSGAALAQGAGASAAMQTADGADAGTVTLTDGPHGILIEADLEGLTPGEHGFHIHETGACDPEFGEAGEHFNPDGSGHGLLAEDGSHAGDVPNIFVGEDGTAKAHFFNPRVTLGDDRDDADSLMDEDGSAIIVHENADSYGEDAGAGGRVACGVIEPGS